MRVWNFGSLNIDRVYKVRTIAVPGETIRADEMQVHCGGKGLNQSIALARAGMEVYHAGMVGKNGSILTETLREAGVHTEWIRMAEGESGHTVIQVDEQGQNCIVICSGTNGKIDKKYVDMILENVQQDDFILLQNEISSIEYILKTAKEKGIPVILNPSPMEEGIGRMDMSGVCLFFINEIEGYQMTGQEEPEQILDIMGERYPEAAIVLTLGKNGSVFRKGTDTVYQRAYPVETVDSTGAGDTFSGYFIGEYFKSADSKKALELAARASALAVTRSGAAESIPEREEVLSWKIGGVTGDE